MDTRLLLTLPIDKALGRADTRRVSCRRRLMGKRLLLTSAGTAASNNVVRSLRTADTPFHIIGCHDDRFILKRSTVDRQHLVPASTRLDFVAALRQLIKAADIDLVIP